MRYQLIWCVAYDANLSKHTLEDADDADTDKRTPVIQFNIHSTFKYIKRLYYIHTHAHVCVVKALCVCTCVHFMNKKLHLRRVLNEFSLHT